jgi:UDP:flavonoid glycosyltransferase YjiC (YdhE family)
MGSGRPWRSRTVAPVGVLAAFVGGWGHAEPLLPVVAVAAEHGHHVTFAGQRAVVPRLAALGFATVAVGPTTLSDRRRPLVPVDRAMEAVVVRDHFVAEFGARRAAELGQLLAGDRPDVVVCDEMDAGAVVAAEAAGIPCVTVGVLAAGRLSSNAVIGPGWEQLRAGQGLPPDPDGARFGGTLRLTPAPASFRDPAVPAPFDLHHVRPPIVDAPIQALAGPAPTVYATLGTVFDTESGDLFARLVQALAMLDPATTALLTIGDHVTRDELPPAPDHVRIEPFVAQRDVLGGCTAVVCHGGTGTLIAALSLGVPVVVLPMGADQPDNADRCVDLGVGIVLDVMSARPAEIADAVRTVLTDGRFAAAAGRLATEAAGQPPVSDVPALLALL